MVSTPFFYLSSSVYLLYEYEECESMGHHKMRESQEYNLPSCFEDIDIDTIASTDDKYEIFTRIFCILEHFWKPNCTHIVSSFIAENDSPTDFTQFLDQFFCLFASDKHTFRMFYRFYRMYFESFSESSDILRNRFREVFLSVWNMKNMNHGVNCMKKFWQDNHFLYNSPTHTPP